MNIEVIVACDKSYGIGKDHTLPWKDSEELSIFRAKTAGSILIMGRVTVEELPHLKGRTIFCLGKPSKNSNQSSTKEFSDVNSLIQGIFEHWNQDDILKRTRTKVFIAGGEKTYSTLMSNPIIYPMISTLHMSIMDGEYDCDSYFDVNMDNWLIQEKKGYTKFTHYVLTKTESPEERVYLNLLRDIKDNGILKQTRNGSTKSVFHRNLSFDVENRLPLLTTKKMFKKGIIEELLFFLRGDTDSKLLESKKVKIWTGNTSREFLDSLGMKDRPEGIMGPMYGYQWRFFDAEYDETTGAPKRGFKGIDQLEYVISEIKSNPDSRRIIMTDFNPNQVSQGVLYPCHSIILQFYAYTKDNTDYLDMFCYIRSSDTFLGLPFNIASSAILLHIIANITERRAKLLHITLGDAHLYTDHLDLVELQYYRQPYIFPSFSITKKLETIADIESMTESDFFIGNYRYHPAIKADMIA